MQPGLPRRRRARPVADAPTEALLARVEDLAKGWLLAVLEDAPLGDAAQVLAGDVAGEGPRVCSAVVRALADDDDLQRLEIGGTLESLASQTGELVGARGLQETARAVQALHSVIWTAVREELSYPDADQISELAERLGLVIELVRVAALQRAVQAGGGESPEPAQREAASSGGTEARGPGTDVRDPRSAVRVSESSDPDAWEAGATGLAPDGPSSGPQPSEPEALAGAVQDLEREASAHAAEASDRDAAEASARKARDPRALWLSALEDEIAQAVRSGAALALLLADLEDAERVLAVEPLGEASATFGRFAQAVRGVVRRQDILACETDTRAWIIARDTARAGAQALASRVADAVGSAGTWRGAPLRVSVGVAVLGEDGFDSTSLVGAAEQGAFAAAASGIGVVRPMPGEDGPRLVG